LANITPRQFKDFDLKGATLKNHPSLMEKQAKKGKRWARSINAKWKEGKLVSVSYLR